MIVTRYGSNEYGNKTWTTYCIWMLYFTLLYNSIYLISMTFFLNKKLCRIEFQVVYMWFLYLLFSLGQLVFSMIIIQIVPNIYQSNLWLACWFIKEYVVLQDITILKIEFGSYLFLIINLLISWHSFYWFIYLWSNWIVDHFILTISLGNI